MEYSRGLSCVRKIFKLKAFCNTFLPFVEKQSVVSFVIIFFVFLDIALKVGEKY